ncbi:MAG TPA: FAD-dependent oxidoreductase [Gemmatimonadales bacterium]
MTVPTPLRVAIVGSGPAAFFTADQLCAREDVGVSVDMLERLPAPFGLVRFGVAPDHQKIKAVTKQFDKAARRPNVRFFGNVEVGLTVTLAELQAHYHVVCFATGAQTDRRLGIPGEDFARSHPATEFVAWYNGHPEFRDRTFDLNVERVAVIGVGNVAVDVARILCRTPEELATTDIADYAETALRASRVREVVMLGRRGPLQAAFTNPEVRELGEMPGADVRARADEVTLDPLSQRALDDSDDRAQRKKLEILTGFTTRQRRGKPRLLTLRFLASPVELLGNEAGEVVGMRIVRNRLEAAGDGTRLKAVPTDQVENLPLQLVFRSVGYHGVPLPGVPFDERSGTVPNDKGRVLQSTGEPMRGVYVSGWIKRGPSGVIGTNKADAAETVDTILADVSGDAIPSPAHTSPEAAECLLRTRQPRCVSYDDWLRLDELEVARGKATGRPRVKFTSVADMLEALERR